MRKPGLENLNTMKYFARMFFALLLCFNYSFGQNDLDSSFQNKSTGAVMVKFADSLNQINVLANSDIANKTLHLLLLTGISPIVYSTDLHFENEFAVKYLESGCTGPKEEFATEYNTVIFKYLTQQYGKEWLKNVRKDVIGLSNYKRSN